MGEVAAGSLCARAAHVDKFKTLSLPISNIANGPNHYFPLKCSNLKWHHYSGTAAEKFCSFENSPAFKKRGKDLNRRIAKRQN